MTLERHASAALPSRKKPSTTQSRSRRFGEGKNLLLLQVFEPRTVQLRHTSLRNCSGNELNLYSISAGDTGYPN